jgi:hypothetical protein
VADLPLADPPQAHRLHRRTAIQMSGREINPITILTKVRSNPTIRGFSFTCGNENDYFDHHIA